MRMESIMWLFPIFFMIHDFEEIIFAKSWLEKNNDYIKKKVPNIAFRFIIQIKELTTASFAFAVAEEFIVLSIITLCSVEFGWYSLFAAILIGYLLHVIAHFAQGIILKKYVPALITGLMSAVYGIYAISYLNNLNLLNWNYIAIAAPFIMLIIILNLIFAHSIAKRLNILLECK
ncbi:MAG: HXXEE domain-containing protein [Syntrophomonas sp.]